MPNFKLYNLTDEVIASADRERDMARLVFRRWPTATCAPYRQQDGAARGEVVLMVWEDLEDPGRKKPPVAFVRTVTGGFRQKLWVGPS